MKKWILTFTALWAALFLRHLAAQVSINPTGAPPDPSAMLDVNSTSGGLLIPRVSTAQRMAIGAPATGLLVFDQTTMTFWYFNGSLWTELGSANAGTSSAIHDTDQDTRVTTEQSPDEDRIRFLIAGSEAMSLLTNASNIPRLELGHPAGNTLVGVQAGAAINPASNGLGERNTLIGQLAGNQATTGYKNTAIGFGALQSTTGGFLNLAAGHEALRDNQTGGYNTALGADAMRSNVSGSNNVAVGHNAMLNNMSGDYHTAIGRNALAANTTGQYNTGVGKHALASNTTGSYNVSLGADAMRFNTTGQYNTGVGLNALVNNTTTSGLTAVGADALRSNTTGTGNTAVGRDALRLNTTGYYNTAAGFESLKTNTNGYANTAFGYTTLQANNTGAFNTAFGAQALQANTWASENSAFGFSALEDNTGGSGNTGIGYLALAANTTGYWNTAAGRGAMTANTTGHSNTAIGRHAHTENTTGYHNTAIGMDALSNNSSGHGNTAVGVQALYLNTTGRSRTALGYNANAGGNVHDFSMGLGYNATCLGEYQVRIGHPEITSIGGYVGWSNLSDGRFKKNIVQDVPGLAFIRLLNPVTYTLDLDGLDDFLGERHHVRDSLRDEQSSGKRDIRYSGFVAQDVEAAAASIGYAFSGIDAPKNPDDLYGLRYAEFVVPLVKAVQEQDELIRAQRVELDQLRAEMTFLRANLSPSKPDAPNTL